VRALLEAHASGEASICPVLSSSPELPSHHDSPLLARDGTLSGTLRGIDLTEPASHLLFAVTDAEGTRHLLLAEAPALLVGARTYCGNDGRRCADLELDAQVLHAGTPVASGNRAVQALTSAQAVASLLTCVQAVGEAAALLEQTIEYLNTREQFGVALSTFQALRHRVVDMYVAYENAYGMVHHLVQAHAQAPLPLAQVLTARLYLASVSRMVGESAIQLHGGMGMATETLAGRLAARTISGAFDHGGRAQCLDWLTAHTLAETA
jgi:alkylation response protein AidB-like acyl-CoA dehydrogenase